MRLGIVGHAADKFNAETEALARETIRYAINWYKTGQNPIEAVVSGHCPLGGVDIWAEEVANELEVPLRLHIPREHDGRSSWHGDGGPVVYQPTPNDNPTVWWHPGFKSRNLAIAEDSDVVLCIVARDYLPDYSGRRFKGCYHCKDRNPPHVKSGGCWTAWKCRYQEWAII